jgi:hypothetical protein
MNDSPREAQTRSLGAKSVDFVARPAIEFTTEGEKMKGFTTGNRERNLGGRPVDRPVRHDGTDSDLYLLYLRFMADAGDVILPMEPNPRCRGRFLAVHKPKSRAEFEAALTEICHSPKRRKSLEETLRAGFTTQATAKGRRKWKRLLSGDTELPRAMLATFSAQ